MKSKFLLTACLASFSFTSQPLLAAEGFTKKQITDLKKYVKDFLIKNPDVIEAALVALQEKKHSEKQASTQKAIQENHEQLFKNENDPVLGNATGKQKLVAFLDPFCGHCRTFKKILLQALEKNQDLKVVIKDFPILGNVAILGAKAMLAANQQGFYSQMQAMIYKAAPSLNKNEVITLAKTIEGIDLDKFKEDLDSDSIQQHLEKNYELAQMIGVAATPTLVIGNNLVEGGVPLEALEKLLKDSDTAPDKS